MQYPIYLYKAPITWISIFFVFSDSHLSLNRQYLVFVLFIDSISSLIAGSQFTGGQ